MDDLKSKLQHAVEKGMLSNEQLQPLMAFLELNDESTHIKGKFDVTHTVWFLGAFLMLFACIIMAVWVNDEFDNEGLFVLGCIYVLGFYIAARHTFSKHMLFLSALLITILVVITPFWLTLGADLLMTLSDKTLQSIFAVVLIITACVAIFEYRFPLLIVAIYAGIIGLISLWFDVDILSQSFWLITGWLTIAIAWYANLNTQMNMTFWLNKIAAIAIGYGISTFINIDTGNIEIMFLWICVALLVISIYLRYPSFVMTAAIGVVTYLNHLVWDIYSDYLWAAALIIAIQAGALILGGMKVFKNKQKIDHFINQHCPTLLVKVRPKPLPAPLSFGV
ncbi:hypothetical protein QX776_08915 [Alteromonadaceae bacterium BrNp21-10]|nr:hypothetical protein [Alteromonadaceae bacterium BrNp21-10]